MSDRYTPRHRPPRSPGGNIADWSRRRRQRLRRQYKPFDDTPINFDIPHRERPTDD